ncbi:MAG: ATP12 family protein [Sphingomonadales bacterium]
MRRFWKDVSINEGAVLLDGRPVKTPARAPLVAPSSALADAIAEEWRAVGEKVDPLTMPLTGFTNAAIDRVSPDPVGFAADLATYGETDLLCYRAENPPELAARQSEIWDPLLGWAQRRYDVAFAVTAGIVHVPQPPETPARLSSAIAARTPFELAALSPIVSIGGSLVVALMLVEDAIEADAAFDATHLDELWQAELWGEDYLATETRAARRADFAAAVRMLRLL